MKRVVERAVLSTVMGLLLVVLQGTAAVPNVQSEKKLNAQITRMVKAELSRNFPRARIDLTGEIEVTRGNIPKSESLSHKIFFISSDARGRAWFKGSGYEFRIPFEAWVQAPVAVRNIRSRERLNNSLFQVREINLADINKRRYKGLILPAKSDFANFEAKHAIPEGQVPLVTSVQRIPDIRRGDGLSIRIRSGDLVVSSRGIAQDSGYVGSNVRIKAESTKKILTGRVIKEGVVEVGI